MAITPVPATARNVHIFEMSNRTRQESLLVLTAEDAALVTARLSREAPPDASHWKPRDEVETIHLAQHMTEASAELFLKMHLEHLAQRTWRFFVWRL